MPAFEYEALDHKGGVKTGVISADSARLARRQLREIRLMPLRLETIEKDRARVSLASVLKFERRKVSFKATMLMTRQLATMISASAPLEEALHTIALQTDNKALRSTLMSIRGSIMEGFRLADAMAQHGHVFSPLYRALVGAGEISGNLGAVLERLADFLEKSDRLRSKVTAALIYPLVLAFVALAVIAILLIFVVPKVVAQFDGMGQELPLLTRMLVGVSEAVSNYGLIGLVVAVMAVIGCGVALKREPVRRRLDGFLLDIPVIGKLLRGLYAARLARTLSTLLSGGAPLVEGLAAAKSTISNLVLLSAINRVLASIREGSSFSAAMRRTSIFPPMVVYMAAIGENTGTLDAMLIKAADHLENEFESFTGTAISLLEPLIIVVLGGVVATIMLAILMPILQLNSLALL